MLLARMGCALLGVFEHGKVLLVTTITALPRLTAADKGDQRNKRKSDAQLNSEQVIGVLAVLLLL
eukprot:15462156-Alexandrium_andersonii.AAC.1